MKGPFDQSSAFATSTHQAGAVSDRFDHDKFLVNVKTWSLGNKYYVYNEANQPLLFVDRPVFKLKANFGIYEDESCARKLLTLRQDTVWAFNSIYSLLDGNDQLVATFTRQGLMSMVRRLWHINDGSGREIAKAWEDSLWKAILRRLPEIGIIGHLFRTNFIVTTPDGSKNLGAFIRRYTMADRHVLDMSADSTRTLDRRIAVGLAILLDNTERRR